MKIETDRPAESSDKLVEHVTGRAIIQNTRFIFLAARDIDDSDLVCVAAKTKDSDENNGTSATQGH